MGIRIVAAAGLHDCAAQVAQVVANAGLAKQGATAHFHAVITTIQHQLIAAYEGCKEQRAEPAANDEDTKAGLDIATEQRIDREPDWHKDRSRQQDAQQPRRVVDNQKVWRVVRDLHRGIWRCGLGHVNRAFASAQANVSFLLVRFMFFSAHKSM